jgi:hypothetical protein
MPEAFFHGSADTVFELSEVPAIAMRVTVNRKPTFPTKQLVDGHVRPLSLYVPQGLVQSAQRVV